MKLQNFPRNCPITALTNEFHSARLPNRPQIIGPHKNYVIKLAGGCFFFVFLYYWLMEREVAGFTTPWPLTWMKGPPQVKLCDEALISKLLDRRWTLLKPDTKIHQIVVSAMQTQNQDDPLGNMLFTNNTSPSFGDSMMKNRSLQKAFYVVRDDLLHPFVNGNKARKLDALFPLVEYHSVTDVVTCGGCQSAHAAAIAVSCAERGIRSHLLLRGEQPAIPTGYNLISSLYGNVIYVPRSLYANREEMLAKHADLIAGSHGSVVWLSDILEASLTAEISGSPNCEQLDARRPFKRVIVVNEGAGDAVGLLGVIRLVKYLSQNHVFGREQPVKVVVDAGTGTTAIGLALGARCLGLPWEVYAIMLADNIDGYRNQEERLVSEFQRWYDFPFVDQVIFRESLQLHWLERSLPRKFGNVLPGEVKVCQQIAQETGILIDPIYTLASWELATRLSQREAHGGAQVVMLHTGGTLGMFGLAQRYKSQFDMLKGGACS